MQGIEVEDVTLREKEKEQGQQISVGNHKRLLLFTWTLPRLLAGIFFIILFLWIFQAEGGFGWNEANLFGWHALMMAMFIVFFTQEAILTFSAPLFSGPFSRRNSHTRTSSLSNININSDNNNGHWIRPKYVHVMFHLGGILSAMLGIVAIYYYKSLSPQPIAFPFYSVYSPHSWLGIAVLILWGLQYTAGVYIYGLGQPTPEQKAILKQIHGYLGRVIYVAGLATCALGLQDMQSSDLASSTPPMSGVSGDDTMGMSVTTGNLTGYYPNSPEAQYSSAATLLLLFTGMATFATMAVNKFVSKT